jgi:8-oxo-dGTP pyrophosphatase MutT (NUDIX family)
MNTPSTPPGAAPETPIRPAASVVILRDGKDGIETFMLVRQEGASMAFSGALVFPGGKVDKADGVSAWNNHAPATPPVPGRPFWIAAIRETFEEAGLLLARSQGGGPLLDAKAAHKIVAAERQARIGGMESDFVDLVAAHRLTLAVDQMIHFGHWITPPWAPRRFDTHFFLVAAPVRQRGLIDEGESSEGLWIKPAEALNQANAGKRNLVPVTRFSLELLASWKSVEEAVTASRQRPVVTVLPKMEKRPEGRFICIPADAGYLSTEALLGPA